MSAFTSNEEPRLLVSRELSIASSFVKQYYTMLNRAPKLLHNFYSDHSTFIHGTVEIANETYTEPIVGREKICKKMTELNLNDCRAKIKQIDCLETLASGLVIQVIGELSNNGRPMRQFLQTFVLAPGRDDGKNDLESISKRNDRRHHEPASANEKFYVLNSIFRYQDDGPESEFDEDVATVVTSLPANTNVDNKISCSNSFSKSSKLGSGSSPSTRPNGSLNEVADKVANSRTDNLVTEINEVEQIAGNLEENVTLSRKQRTVDGDRQAGMVVEQAHQNNSSNGSNDIVSKKPDMSDSKLYENIESSEDQSSNQVSNSAPALVGVIEKSITTTNSITLNSQNTTQPSEPKTWANMVRSSQTQTSSSPISSAPQNVQTSSKQQQSSSATTDQQPQQPQPSGFQQQQQSSASGQQQQQQNQKDRRRLNRKPTNKGPAANRAIIKMRQPRPPAASAATVQPVQPPKPVV